MKPWETLDRFRHEDPEAVLKTLPPDDPFWIGASYGLDPFVGMIVRRPMRDPHSYGQGASAELFERIAKTILDGQLHGDQLAMILERFSHACTEPEWTRWYGPIFRGELLLPFGLELYNKYAAERLQPPSLNKPSTSDPLPHLPKRFFVQPGYEGFGFWFITSKDEPIEVRGYDGQIQRVRDERAEAMLAALGHTRPMDVVMTGYMTPDGLLAEDLLTREQFTREGVVLPLQQRLLAAAKIGFRLVQMSDEFTKPDQDFLQELSLIFQQGYKSALVRDLDASYPFRKQPDFKVTSTRLSKLVKALS